MEWLDLKIKWISLIKITLSSHPGLFEINVMIHWYVLLFLCRLDWSRSSALYFLVAMVNPLLELHWWLLCFITHAHSEHKLNILRADWRNSDFLENEFLMLDWSLTQVLKPAFWIYFIYLFCASLCLIEHLWNQRMKRFRAFFLFHKLLVSFLGWSLAQMSCWKTGFLYV